MHAFDASSIIHAWDHYPPEQFPKVWVWIGSQIEDKEFVICKVAMEEVEKRMPECHDWLCEQEIQVVSMPDPVFQKASTIKGLLGIVGDQFHSKGVGENDLLIVSSAFCEGHRLVSNEGPQPIIPQTMKKYKIPRVCGLPDVSVDCIDFLTLIKESGQVFGE